MTANMSQRVTAITRPAPAPALLTVFGAANPSRRTMLYLPLRVLLAALAWAALALTGCGGGENNVTSGNKSHTLHWGNGAEPQELDPHIVTGIPEHHIIVALLEGLVLKDPLTLEPIPGVATSWTVNETGTVYTFQLRPNARWSNGDPLTAEDFVWSWQRALQPELGNLYAYMYYPIKNAEAYATGKLNDFSQVGVKALSSHQLQVTLTHPTPYFLQLLDHYSMFPVHRPTIEAFGAPSERGTRWTRAGNFVGNGAFVLAQWDLNKVVVVKKNPLYWDAEQVALNEIRFYPTENVSTEERMFRAGQLHVTGSLPTDKIAVYRQQAPQFLRISPYLGTYYYRINTRVPHLGDKRVRRALALAIDRQSIVDNVTRGGQIPASTFTPPDTLNYSAEPAFGYDPQRARELLSAAGYPNGDGFPTTEILYNTSEGHQKIAVALQQMWKTVLNIDVTLNNQDWKVYLDNEASGNFQISRSGWIGDYVDPNTFLDLWLTGGGNNRTGWSNLEYDELVTQKAPTASDRATRYGYFRRAEAILLDEMPVIPLYIYTSVHLVHDSVIGMPGNILDYALYKNISLRADH